MPNSRIVCYTTLFLAMLSLSPVTLAMIITFDLRNPAISSSLDGLDSGQVMNAGLGAVFGSFAGTGRSSVFNHTTSSFGINSLSTTLDSPSLIDGGDSWSEVVQVFFSEFVYLREITFSSFTTLEWAGLLVSGQTGLLLQGKTSAIDSYSFNDIEIPVGASLFLSHVSGNGFSLDRLRVETVSVPEPDAFILILLALVLLFRRRQLSLPAWPSGVD